MDKRQKSVRRILNAAMEVFAEIGYEGAKVDDIAAKAGVNKAMIYYRIGDKKTLYESVIHDVFGDQAERLNENIKPDWSPEEKLKACIADIAGTMIEHPHFSRLVMREIASGWTNFGETVLKDIGGILALFERIVEEGVKKGVFTPTGAALVHTMTFGTLVMWNLSMPVKEYFNSVLGKPSNASAQGSFDGMVGDLQRLMLRALRP